MKCELEILKRFDLLNWKVVVTASETNHKLDSDSEGDDVDATNFNQVVGSLGYLCNTIPDICYAIGIVSRFMSKPKWYHYQAAVRILRYIKGTLKYGVMFPYGEKTNPELMYYSDSDWCGDRVDERNTSGYLFKFLEVIFLGVPRSNQLLLCQTMKLNIFQVLWLHVKLFGF
ncbi:uncharacterized mitochondrial protein AtMg00240-like [Lathyrus oleraceus]|uniref:uncharacterized mitochondrial protein AtMg00240-like n=1 Tax=Pisum sativum TaxID=3888 RepID=UPI0021D29E2B|nr:uncharacterized mitochondrial protein AtMg00240-like [Pisum sativum]